MKAKASVEAGIGIVCLAVLVLFGTTGAVGAKPVVSIGHVANLTGVYGPGTRGLNEGFLDAVGAVNKYGNLPVELKGVWVDGASNPATAMSATKKMVEQHAPVILIGGATPIALALKGYCMKKKIPWIEGGGADPLWALPSWSFSAMSPYQNQLGAWVDYYLKYLWPKKGLERAPNFAWLTWDNAAGRASVTDKVREYIQSKGVNIAPGDGEFIPGVPMEVGAQILRLKNNEVDLTFGMLLHTTAVAVLKGAEKHGVVDQIDFFITTPNPDGLVEAVKGLARNTYGGIYTWSWDLLEEKSCHVVEAYAKNNRTVPKVMYVPGFSWTLVAAQAIRMVAEDVGPNNITGELCYKALKRMKDYDRWGVGCKITFGEKKRYGCDTVILQRLNNNRVNSIGEFPTPNLTKFEF